MGKFKEATIEEDNQIYTIHTIDMEKRTIYLMRSTGPSGYYVFPMEIPAEDWAPGVWVGTEGAEFTEDELPDLAKVMKDRTTIELDDKSEVLFVKDGEIEKRMTSSILLL